MGLQLRRGTNAERLQITPLQGELVYTTDTKNVYVGDGQTIGGIAVTAFTSEDAQDAVATLFENGTHSGISFTYNDANNSINAVVTPFTVEDAQDAIATLFENGTHSGITYTYNDANNSISSSVTATYSLNSLSNVNIVAPLSTGQVLKYDSANSKWFNSADTGIMNVVEDTSPQLGGALDLNGYNITSQGNVVLDATNYSLHTSKIKLVSNQIIVSDDYLTINHPDPNKSVSIRHNVDRPTQHYILNCITGGAATAGVLTNTSRGSLSTPTTVQPGDALSFTNIQYAHNGTGYVLSSGIGYFADQEATISNTAVPGKIVIATYADGVTPLGVTVNSKGWVSINHIGSTVNATLDINGFAKLAILGSEPSSSANGMVAIANGTTWDPTNTGKQTMVAFLGGSWVQLAVAP